MRAAKKIFIIFLPIVVALVAAIFALGNNAERNAEAFTSSVVSANGKVYVDGGTYNIGGGKISSSSGPALYVGSSGKVNMTSGTIDGDVHINGGSMTMTGGSVNNNVYVNGTFSINASPTISGSVYLDSGKYITLTAKPTRAITVVPSTLTAGTKIAYASSSSYLDTSMFKVSGLSSGMSLSVNENYIEIKSTATYYTVTFRAGTGGTVSQSAISNVLAGTRAEVKSNSVTINGETVIALHNVGYRFSSWSSSSGSFVVNSNITITANFNAIPANRITFIENPIDDIYNRVQSGELPYVAVGIDSSCYMNSTSEAMIAMMYQAISEEYSTAADAFNGNGELSGFAESYAEMYRDLLSEGIIEEIFVTEGSSEPVHFFVGDQFYREGFEYPTIRWIESDYISGTFFSTFHLNGDITTLDQIRKDVKLGTLDRVRVYIPSSDTGRWLDGSVLDLFETNSDIFEIMNYSVEWADGEDIVYQLSDYFRNFSRLGDALFVLPNAVAKYLPNSNLFGEMTGYELMETACLNGYLPNNYLYFNNDYSFECPHLNSVEVYNLLFRLLVDSGSGVYDEFYNLTWPIVDEPVVIGNYHVICGGYHNPQRTWLGE